MSDRAEVINFPAAKRNTRRDASRRPEAMIGLPGDNQDLVREAMKIIEVCRADQGYRAAYYRQLLQLSETGRGDGTRSLVNMLYNVIDRLSSHLFSPTDVRFTMDFEYDYPIKDLERGKVAARMVSRSWERTNTDLMFAAGVFESLRYGAMILKQWPRQVGTDRLPVYESSLIMPWQFGVYKPDENSLDKQPAMVQTVPLTLPEVWRRIYALPNARGLYDRIKQHAQPAAGDSLQNTFFHQVLSTSPIQTGVNNASRPVPGGVVQMTSDSAISGMRPDSAAPRVLMHELWVWGQDDYITVQIIEPDILIAPQFKRSNLLVPGAEDTGLQPFSLIQPNAVVGNIWGRSELADIAALQDMLSDTSSDIQRLFKVQVDKFIAFTGGDGMTDEMYDAGRAAGYVNLGPGAGAHDLTPKFPEQALPLFDKLVQMIEMISGFDNLLSGRGEGSVRSGVQSNPLMKAAGARLKDRSLLVERQCAAAADLRLSLMEAKDGRTYWTDKDKMDETSFLLSDLPDDRRITVDSHTTSPIFADEHQNLVLLGAKAGWIDGESAIEMMPFQNKDTLLARLKAKQAAAAKQMEELKTTNPEEYYKILEKQAGGARRR